MMQQVSLGAAALEPYAAGLHVNAMSDEGATGVRRAYLADKLAVLTALKNSHDLDNVFLLNPNIQPARWPGDLATHKIISCTRDVRSPR
jgi:hypothetical protein